VNARKHNKVKTISCRRLLLSRLSGRGCVCINREEKTYVRFAFKSSLKWLVVIIHSNQFLKCKILRGELQGMNYNLFCT